MKQMLFRFKPQIWKDENVLLSLQSKRWKNKKRSKNNAKTHEVLQQSTNIHNKFAPSEENAQYSTTS